MPLSRAEQAGAAVSGQQQSESILDPDLPIIDAHHHLWFLPETTLAAIERRPGFAARTLAAVFRRRSRYLLDEFIADVSSGHNIRATVFVEAHAMYKAQGPEALRSVGEIEFANGIAATTASGVFGESKVCASIVGNVDLCLGHAVEEILMAHIRAGGDRYRGIRARGVAHDDDECILGPGVGIPNLLSNGTFREGFSHLHPLGLSFDAWLLEPQLPELTELARAFPETQIILNHVGGPVGVGRYAGERESRLPIWQERIRTLARCPNVVVKLGGLGVPFVGFRYYDNPDPPSSAQLANEWRPYIETCIEVFGVQRCMFESNYPVDSAAGSYSVLWNTFKRLVSGASPAEKAALFFETAAHVYKIDPQ